MPSPKPVLTETGAYTVRFDAQLTAKMRRWQDATRLPGTEILRRLVDQAEDIEVQVIVRSQEKSVQD